MLTQVIAENKRCLGVGRGGVEIVKQCRRAMAVDKATVLYGESRGGNGGGGHSGNSVCSVFWEE